MVFGLLTGNRLDAWTALFLATTVATSVTGFAFPFDHLLPSHKVGIISLAVLAVASLLFGFLADRLSRRAVIAFGIIFWSLATFASGMAGTFMFLLMTRALVGVGEGAYAPAAQSMISGAFPQERRAFAQAIFATGMLALAAWRSEAS